MMTKLRPTNLRIDQFDIDLLKPDQRNPRKHSPRQIRQIAKSVDSFGFNVPVLIDGDNKIIAGHGRVLACRALGITSVPIIRLEHLTPAQARAFNIADNKLTENGEWDSQLLGEVFLELSTQDLDFDIDATGFSISEIDLNIEGLSTATTSGPAKDDQIHAPQTYPVSSLGDLWQLGRHRVLCGDALKWDSYDSLMQGDRATVVFTDPPFNVPIDGHATGNGRIRHREFAMANGEMSPREFTDFLSTVFRHLVKSSTDGSLHYICMDWRHQMELLVAGTEIFSTLKNLCVWSKNNAGMGSFYRSQHELIFVFKSGAGKHRNNIELGRHGRHRSNVWQYPGINTFGRKGEEGDLLAMHPTVKPVALVADAILDCSTRRDVVLDPFLGSGTTVIAAERVGRVCRAMELDPLYVDNAIRRWQRYTGDHAVHSSSGKTFDSIAEQKKTSHD